MSRIQIESLTSPEIAVKVVHFQYVLELNQKLIYILKLRIVGQLANFSRVLSTYCSEIEKSFENLLYWLYQY